jgi:putative inorganic carbon (HCO3(-)) transporter
MRDLVLLVFVCASLPVCFFQPFFGVLMWIGVAYFNPHRFTFAYMYHFPIAAVVAVPTIAGLLIKRDIYRPIFVRETVWLLALWAWFGLVYFNALHQPLFARHVAYSEFELTRVSKILLMTFVIIVVTTSEKRLKWVFLVTAFSFGVLALKGALFGLVTGGHRVFGPPDSFIDDNNSFALALNMSLPSFYFLGRLETNKILRVALKLAFVGSIVSIILTYSRGGFLGLVAVLSGLVWRSRYRILGLVLFATIGLMVVSFAPPQWMERMDTLRQEGVDSSAQERLVSWGTTWNFLQDYPLMGGSFYALPDEQIFQKYKSRELPGGYQSSGPHSIYFQVLGEQGFIGFLIYFGLVASCLVSLFQLRRRTASIPQLSWISVYSDIITISLFGFLVSGAFLGFADFDLYYQLVACVCVLKILYSGSIAASTAVAPVIHGTIALSRVEAA